MSDGCICCPFAAKELSACAEEGLPSIDWGVNEEMPEVLVRLVAVEDCDW